MFSKKIMRRYLLKRKRYNYSNTSYADVERFKKIDKELDSEYTNLKLKDIAMLYSEYEAKLSNNFIDENDSLTILANDLDNTDMFDGALIYIDEFLGLRGNERKEYRFDPITIKFVNKFIRT